MLPKGWAETTLGDMGTWGSGGTPKASNASFYGGSIPWLRSGDLSDGPIEGHEATITDDGLKNSAAKWVQPGSILIAMYGATIGKLGLSTYPVTTNQAVAFVKPFEQISGAFLFALLKASKPKFVELGQGGAQPNISQEILKRQPIHLPPLAEQRRIVAKLDALTARLVRARTELERVTSLQTRFRRRVFDAAVAGELSSPLSSRSAWTRDQQRSIYERRADYLSNRRGSRLGSGLEAAVEFLQGARSNWLDCRLADVISLRVGHAFKSAGFAESGMRLLRGANVAPGRVDWSDTVCMPESKCSAYSQYALCKGDIVLAMDRPLISSGLKIAQVTCADEPCLLVQRVANPRSSEYISNDYLQLVLQSSLFLKQIEDHATGSDLPHISSNDILMTSCPLPPLDEQQRIVEVAQNSLARADRLEAEAARARALLDRLEAALLAKAFRGELVPQNPADEPASVLLGRIRDERVRVSEIKRSRNRRPAA